MNQPKTRIFWCKTLKETATHFSHLQTYTLATFPWNIHWGQRAKLGISQSGLQFQPPLIS